MSRNLHVEIARRAYALWETGGRVSGRDLDYWLEAENEILREVRSGLSADVCVTVDTNRFRQMIEALVPVVEGELNLHREQASKENAQKIRQNCPKDFHPIRHALRSIQKGLITKFVLNRRSFEPYYDIAAAILDCKNEEVNEHSKAPNWPELIRLGRERCRLHPSVYKKTEELLRHQESRFFAVADAALRLREKGYLCVVEDDSPFFSETERRRIISAIEDKIGALGAICVINNLCQILRQDYSEEMQRYLMPSRLSLVGGPKSPSLPINLLLQLAVKQVQLPTPALADAQEQWNELQSLAKDFAAIYDAEPYSHWELEFIDAHTLAAYLVDLALHDRMCGIRQYRSRDIEKVLRGLFDWVPVETEVSMGWSISEACAVLDAIVPIANATGVTVFSSTDLTAACEGVDARKARGILAAFTHSQNPNQEFNLPEISGTTNLFAKPLISADGEKLIMVDRAVCAPAFYEAIATVLRPHDDQTQNKIGVAAERFLIKEMRERGVSVSSGTYKSSHGDGECDAVVETDDTIIFLELKGKPLTNAAQAGSDVMILLDLLKSLINATFQSNHHEIVLRTEGHIQLSQKDGTQYRLELGRRAIEKVAVTILDFGRFQDRTVLTQVLRTLLTATVTPYEERWENEFLKLNKKTAALRTQINELDKVVGGLPQPFFNCWFLSIPQVLVLLDQVDSNKSFKAELWRTRHLTTHSLDWYSEMNYARKLDRRT